MDKNRYEELISKYRFNEKDTGSSQVQIINLTKRISDLTNHMKEQKKDIRAKRTLLKLVASRKRFLKYLKTQNNEKFTYEEFISDLKIKG